MNVLENIFSNQVRHEIVVYFNQERTALKPPFGDAHIKEITDRITGAVVQTLLSNSEKVVRELGRKSTPRSSKSSANAKDGKSAANKLSKQSTAPVHKPIVNKRKRHDSDDDMTEESASQDDSDYETPKKARKKAEKKSDSCRKKPSPGKSKASSFCSPESAVPLTQRESPQTNQPSPRTFNSASKEVLIKSYLDEDFYINEKGQRRKLNPTRKQKMEDEVWQKYFDQLLGWHDRHGHYLIPDNALVEDDQYIYRLGEWCALQRHYFEKDLSKFDTAKYDMLFNLVVQGLWFSEGNTSTNNSNGNDIRSSSSSSSNYHGHSSSVHGQSNRGLPSVAPLVRQLQANTVVRTSSSSEERRPGTVGFKDTSSSSSVVYTSESIGSEDTQQPSSTIRSNASDARVAIFTSSSTVFAPTSSNLPPTLSSAAGTFPANISSSSSSSQPLAPTISTAKPKLPVSKLPNFLKARSPPILANLSQSTGPASASQSHKIVYEMPLPAGLGTSSTGGHGLLIDSHANQPEVLSLQADRKEASAHRPKSQPRKYTPSPSVEMLKNLASGDVEDGEIRESEDEDRSAQQKGHYRRGGYESNEEV